MFAVGWKKEVSFFLFLFGEILFRIIMTKQCYKRFKISGVWFMDGYVGEIL